MVCEGCGGLAKAPLWAASTNSSYEDLERAAHNVEIVEKCAHAYLMALCTGRKVSKIPLAVREIAFLKLRGDQKKAERGEISTRGE